MEIPRGYGIAAPREGRCSSGTVLILRFDPVRKDGLFAQLLGLSGSR